MQQSVADLVDIEIALYDTRALRRGVGRFYSKRRSHWL